MVAAVLPKDSARLGTECKKLLLAAVSVTRGCDHEYRMYSNEKLGHEFRLPSVDHVSSGTDIA